MDLHTFSFIRFQQTEGVSTNVNVGQQEARGVQNPRQRRSLSNFPHLNYKNGTIYKVSKMLVRVTLTARDL